MNKKEKKYGLLKGILLFVLIAVVLSWLIPNGQYAATGFQSDGTLARVGLTDVSWLVYYGFYFALDKIVLLLAIGGLYGILTKTSAYERIVSGIAKKLTNKQVTVVAISVVIAALTSILTQTFAVLIFVPFIVSIMNRMKLDKMTILATTFGSMLVGILGATIGTEGLVLLNTRYIIAEGFDPNKTALIRAGILVIGLVLFNFLTLSHMKRVEKNAPSADMFPVVEEEVKEENKNKKASVLPIAIIGALLLILVILGFVNWGVFTSAEETIFQTFHETVMDIHIKDFYVFKSILGSSLGAFGSWDLFVISAVVMIFTAILALCYRFNFNDFVKHYADGVKKMIVPCLVIAGANALLTVVYMSPYVATIVNKLLTLTDGFNLATMSLSAFIANIFHTDLGYTGYVLGTYLSAEYVDYLNPVYVIFSSLYGFVQFFIPTSVVLGVGLTSLDVKYKDWLSHIWKFLIGMIICLLIIFILMAVI